MNGYDISAPLSQPCLYGKSLPKITRVIWFHRRKILLLCWDDYVSIVHKSSGAKLLHMTWFDFVYCHMLNVASVPSAFGAMWRATNRKARK